MKYLFSFMMIAALLLSSLGSLPGAAQEPQPTGETPADGQATPGTPAVDQPTPAPEGEVVAPPLSIPGPPPSFQQSFSLAPGDTLLFLDMPDLASLELPGGLNRSQARQLAETLAGRQMTALQGELDALASRGVIARYQVQDGVVAVQAAGEALPGALQSLPGVQAADAGSALDAAAEGAASDAAEGAADDAAAPPAAGGLACATGYVQALGDQLYAISLAQALPPPTAEAVAATNPSIQVLLDDDDFTRVAGQTNPNTVVTMRILRGGQQAAYVTTTSSSNGTFYFMPAWLNGCPGAYSWQAMPGDVVEVTAAGRKVSTVVAALNVWTDPNLDIVTGQTDPGRQVTASLFTNTISCGATEHRRSGGVDPQGRFILSFGPQVNFKRDTSGTLISSDPNGNFTYRYTYAFQLYANLLGDFGGALKPDVSYQVSLQRGSTVLERQVGRTTGSGEFYGGFSSPVQPGDVLTAVGGEATVSFVLVPLSASVSAGANNVTGKTALARPVKVQLSHRTRAWEAVTNTCVSGLQCISGVSDAGGNFSLGSAFDILDGDRAALAVYDAEGNYQYGDFSAQVIGADPVLREVRGYWGRPGAALTINLKTSGGALKDSDTTTASAVDGEFYGYLWNAVTINAGDRIEVTDGAQTESLQVQNLTAELNYFTESVTGAAPAGRLLSVLNDFVPSQQATTHYCQSVNVPAGAYQLGFAAAQTGAQDSAQVYSFNADGNFLVRASHALQARTYLNSAFVTGYVPVPNQAVTVRIYSGATIVMVGSDTASATGLYYVSLPGNLVAGHTVEVSASQTVSLSLPNLTINTDPPNNRLFGKAPAHGLLLAGLDYISAAGKHSTSTNSASRLAQADAAGNYSTVLSNLTFIPEAWGLCITAQVGGVCTQPWIEYIHPNEHTVGLDGAFPKAVSADAFENDDSVLAASNYTPLAQHTFHATTDVDWIRFTVSAAEVGRTLYLTTTGLGPTADTILELYASNGSTLLASNDDGGVQFGSAIAWKPTAAGTYYLKVRPFGDNRTANCGAFYQVFIGKELTFLPFVGR